MSVISPSPTLLRELRGSLEFIQSGLKPLSGCAARLPAPAALEVGRGLGHMARALKALEAAQI
jgi:hypothetical protein